MFADYLDETNPKPNSEANVKKSIRFTLLSVLLLAAYLLSACAGVASQGSSPSKGSKVQAEVAFTGTVEAIDGNQWIVNGQVVTVDSKTALGPNVKVGDLVKVEGSLGQGGALVAARIETSGSDDVISTPDVSSTPSPDASGTPDASSTPDPLVSSTPSALDDGGNEVFGTVEAIGADSVTINDQMYQLSVLTEFKDVLAIGDLVKVHLVFNADGTVTVREIEKSTGLGVDDHSGSDDGTNHDANDDHRQDGSGHDSSDDHHGGDSGDDHGDDYGGSSGG